MPYIKPELRPLLDPTSVDIASTPGELNFQFTRLVIRYMVENGVSYSAINDVMGAFLGAALEFYQRIAVPYENTKIEENGDVGYESLTW